MSADLSTRVHVMHYFVLCYLLIGATTRHNPCGTKFEFCLPLSSQSTMCLGIREEVSM